MEKLLLSIKNDDEIIFSQIFNNLKDKNISFGRFPILSLCYLYSSKKIIKKYEKRLLKIKEYKKTNEPFILYQKFRNISKKAILLYQKENSIIEPIEILALLKRNQKVKKLFKYASLKNHKNLIFIYKNINNQNIMIAKNKIKIGSEKISNYKKSLLIKNLFFSSSFIFITIITYIILNFTIGTSFISPSKIFSKNQLSSCFTNNSNSILKEDLIIDNFNINTNFYGSLNGENHTIIITKLSDYLFKNNYGTIKNINIIYNISQIDEISFSTSLLCSNNYGTIENINIFFEYQNEIILNKQNEVSFSCLCNENNGTIKNSTISLNAHFKGINNNNGYVCGICIDNYNLIEKCKITENSNLILDEIDASGIAISNNQNGKIKNCASYMNIKQNNSNNSWSPTISGISNNNYGNIEYCLSNCSLEVNSTSTETEKSMILVGGICSLNYNLINHSKFIGEITSNADVNTTYIGGICAQSTSAKIDNNTILISNLLNCGVEANFNVSTNNSSTCNYVGGFCGFLYGKIENCFSISTFTNDFDENKNFVGLAFGSIFYTSYYNIFFQVNYVQYISGQNNYVLTQENISNQIGVMIYNGNSSNNLPNQNTFEDIVITTTQNIIEEKVYY